MIEPGYGWIRVSQFQEPTVDDLAKKITALFQQDPNMKGLVLDLRNDPGGVLPGAIGVSAAFLPKDVPVVSTNGQLPDSKATYFARREYYATRVGGDPLTRIPDLRITAQAAIQSAERFTFNLTNTLASQSE